MFLSHQNEHETARFCLQNYKACRENSILPKLTTRWFKEISFRQLKNPFTKEAAGLLRRNSAHAARQVRVKKPAV